jgi:hypothetical protein
MYDDRSIDLVLGADFDTVYIPSLGLERMLFLQVSTSSFSSAIVY